MQRTIVSFLSLLLIFCLVKAVLAIPSGRVLRALQTGLVTVIFALVFRTVAMSNFICCAFFLHRTRGVYGKSDRFTYTASMVFIQCVINAIFARIG